MGETKVSGLSYTTMWHNAGLITFIVKIEMVINVYVFSCAV